tara:strand:- start:891 stop:1748 length:858 start_codon:yes stop_codon:yes gene_type:complete
MSPQGDLVVANANGATFRSDMNDQLMALGTLSSGSSEPSTTYAYQLWADTSNNLLKIRNGANNAWLEIGDITAANLALAKLASPTFTGTVTTPELSCSGTSRLKLPVGTTAQRPGSPATGDTRVNSTLSQVEAYDGSAWINLGGGTPTGAIYAMGTSTVPTGFLECNGAAVSRSTYATLFSTISTTFGAGDGSSTFNLPDLRGEFIRGWDNSRGVDSGRSLGSTQDEAFKAHTHTYIDQQNDANGGYRWWKGGDNDCVAANKETASTGGSETRPRNVALMYVIKT